MPNRRGYPQRGGSYQSNYQYQQPTASQYESFFNPIPIDFLQQNLQQHQGRYDQAFAGALAAKEAALQESIALGDTAYMVVITDVLQKIYHERLQIFVLIHSGIVVSISRNNKHYNRSLCLRILMLISIKMFEI